GLPTPAAWRSCWRRCRGTVPPTVLRAAFGNASDRHGASLSLAIAGERIMAPKTPRDSGPSATGARQAGASCAAGACPWTRRPWNWLLWGALLAGVVAVQWPFLKGMVYRQVEAPASSIGWRTDFDAALVEAARTNRPLLVDFTADWCPPCHVMKHEV